MKKYSVFISSHFGSLTKEREYITKKLLDYQLLPVGMEHFTITSNEEFEPLKKLIDQTDIFILLLGDTYGSCDENGISWTQREYEYVNRVKAPYENKNKCYVIKTEKFVTLKEKDPSLLTEDEEKLLAFGDKTGMAQMVTEERTMDTIINQIVSDVIQNSDELEGWRRPTVEEKQALVQWQESHKALDLRGDWYHVFYRDDDSNYVRFGKITIKQNFNENDYQNLVFNAKNYNVLYYNDAEKKLTKDTTCTTVWSGNYHLDANGNIIGAYKAERRFKEDYGDWKIDPGHYSGIQELMIVDNDDDGDSADETTVITGTFNDVKPSPKMGRAIFFKHKAERDRFVIRKFKNVLKEE